MLDHEALIANESYEEFIKLEPDLDTNESFYPPPELDEYYEPEMEVQPQNLHGASAVATGGAHTPMPNEDLGNMSEEVCAPSFGGEVDVKPRRKKGRR